MKEKYDHRLLLKHLPSDLRVFLEHIQVLLNIYYSFKLDTIKNDQWDHLSCINSLFEELLTL